MLYRTQKIKIFVIDLKNEKFELKNSKKLRSSIIKYILKKEFNYTDIIYTSSFLKPMTINKEVCFNMSHSNFFIVLATSTEPVGIDIEMDRYIDKTTIDYFINACDVNRKAPIHVWTAKESFLKLLGVGLSIEPIPVKVYENTMECGGVSCYYKTEKIFDKYYLSVSAYNRIVLDVEHFDIYTIATDGGNELVWE